MADEQATIFFFWDNFGWGELGLPWGRSAARRDDRRGRRAPRDPLGHPDHPYFRLGRTG